MGAQTSYGSDVRFKTREEGYEVRDHLIEIANCTGYVTEEEFFNAVGLLYDAGCDEECSIGWSLADILGTSVDYYQLGPLLREWFIDLPAPKDISNLMAKNINKNIMEDKTMNKVNYNSMLTKTPVHLYNYEDSPEDVEFEKKRKELTDEAEKKILDIRKELAVALDKLDEERFEQEMQRRDAMQAKAWKRKYDALIAEGFTIEQAWEMTMKWFEAD